MSPVTVNKPFWQRKTLAEMTPEQWESLCDGCGKCCLHKLEDEDTGEVCYTNVACAYLDDDQCRCSRYAERQQLVPDCITLSPDQVDQFHWLPSSCAYRLLAAGQPLPPWHHLLTGTRETMHEQGQSVRGRVISERHVHPRALEPEALQEQIIHWVNGDDHH